MSQSLVSSSAAPSPGKVTAIRRHFEALQQSCDRSRATGDDSGIGKDRNEGFYSLHVEEAANPRSESPAHSTPSRCKPNTYQSAVISGLRKKYTGHTYHESGILPADDVATAVGLEETRVPIKPPRTFAHDVYVQEKEEIKALVVQKYRRKREDDGGHRRRRSRSADLEARQAVRRAPLTPAYCNIADLFDQTSPVESIIRQSFGKQDDMPALWACRAGNAETEQAVSYARALRMGLRGKTISHYSPIADMSIRDARICKYVTMYDNESDCVTIHPPPSDPRKLVFVKKFSQSFKDKDDRFCWFAFTEQNFFYTYFLSQENRVLSLSSDLYSPHFFSVLLKAISPASRDFPDREVINELVTKKIPLPGEVVSVKGSEIEVPWQLPRVMDTKQSLLLTHMEPEVILMCVATLIQERRLAFVSHDTDLLVEASKALLSLLYPLAWDYMFWPFVPMDLVKLCAALTLPYFICLQRDQCSPFLAALERRSKKILVVDLDERCIVQQAGNEKMILPKSYSSSVCTAMHLSRNMTDPTECLRDKLMRETFLQVFTQLLGPVTSHIWDGVFCKDSFVKSLTGREDKSFFRWFSETRLFENFVKYWQVRSIHAKYMPATKKLLHMDLFERKTESMRHQLHKSTEKKEKSTAVGWSGTAMRVVEKRLAAIGNKIKKHM